MTELPDEIEQALNRCTSLPSLPAVAMKIIEASKTPDIGLQQVADIIASDPAISVKLLKIANSPLYSQRRTLNNLREALTLLGFNATLTIALSFTLMQSLAKNAAHEKYWKRSILAASIARILGKMLKVGAIEDLFLASLLQDIGILVFQCLDASPYDSNSDRVLSHQERIQLEEDMLGIDHALVGAWLIQSWNLPDYLVQSVLYSHSLNRPGEQSRQQELFHYCLHLSGSMADIWLEDNPGEALLSILDVARTILNLDNEGFNQLIVDIDALVPEICTMFDIELLDNNKREQVVNEAREILLERNLASIKQAEDDRNYIANITSRVEQIEKASQLDHLTGIYNRQHIDSLLELEFSEALKNSWPLSLAFIDIDNFKEINDSYGHLAGDEILKNISRFFADNIRETDKLARYGGDEFLLMLPGSSNDAAETILKRLLQLFQQEVYLQVKGENIQAGVSIGLASHGDVHKFDDLKGLMSAADDALYRAKEKGKNCLAVYS